MALVISEIYSAGGNTNAIYNSDFVVLHNTSTTSVSLTGYSLQYAAAAGLTWQVGALTGTIAAGGYFLIELGSGPNGIALPPPDLTLTILMGTSGGKVALVNATTPLTGANPIGDASIVDFVGYGAASGSETTPAIAGSATTSIQRVDDNVDTNNNSADFTTAAPVAKNSSSPANPVPDPLQFVNLQFPDATSFVEGQTSAQIFGQVFETGVTEASGAPSGIIAQLGYGALGSDPRSASGWVWTTATYHLQVGNNDEFVATISGAAAGQYAYTYRFSQDGGLTWTYGDLDGNGDNSGLSFSTAQLGTLTVTSNNSTPTDIGLSNALVQEFRVNGTAVGTLSATDPNLADTFTFSLLDTAGGRFSIVGNQLRVANGLLLDFEQAASHSVTVRVTDNGGLTFDKQLTIALGDVNPENITGNASANTLFGGALADTLKGAAGNDTLRGNAGSDELTGGTGRDTLTGNAGLDDFNFNILNELGKTATTRDVIKDFTHLQDDIDLHLIDAKSTVGGNQAFTFIGTSAFHKVAGELHAVKINPAGTANDKTIVEGDVTGDGKADFQIELTGLKVLTAADFLL